MGLIGAAGYMSISDQPIEPLPQETANYEQFTYSTFPEEDMNIADGVEMARLPDEVEKVRTLEKEWEWTRNCGIETEIFECPSSATSQDCVKTVYTMKDTTTNTVYKSFDKDKLLATVENTTRDFEEETETVLLEPGMSTCIQYWVYDRKMCSLDPHVDYLKKISAPMTKYYETNGGSCFDEAPLCNYKYRSTWEC